MTRPSTFDAGDLGDLPDRRSAVVRYLVLEEIELRPGDTELLADAVITDIDGGIVRLGVASFSLDELAERYPHLGLGW